MLLLCVPGSVCTHTAQTISSVLLSCYAAAVNSYLDGNAEVFDYQSILHLMLQAIFSKIPFHKYIKVLYI